MATRQLIVNADDFGLSPGVNAGVVRAHEGGIVTSASLMVRAPAAADAAAYARDRPALSVGLHVDLGEWVFEAGAWAPAYVVVPAEDATAVGEELRRQLNRFGQLMGQSPTHLDSHQHVHLREPVTSAMVELATRLHVPLRSFSSSVRFCGDFYGQTGTGEPWPDGISPESLIALLERLPPGVTELSCHAGTGDDLDSVYGVERTLEVEVLCDPSVRAAIEAEQIVLRSFREVSWT
ncbi:MAG: carbohydrate deacetylase [Acidimicrobiia bacterium]